MKKIAIFFTIIVLSLLIKSEVLANEGINQDIPIVDASNHIYTFAEMECDIAQLQTSYPNYFSCYVTGMSVDGRRIWELVIGNPQAPKAIYIQAAIHGREWMNSWMLMKQIEMIMLNWNTPIADGVNISSVFEKCAVYIVPMVNPDGVTISESGINAITNPAVRENLYRMKGATNPARWKANAAGVDLNRNFSTGWGNVINVNAPSSQCYNGICAFTEPEILAVVNVFMQRRFEAAITYHSMEGAIYWDIGQTGDILNKTYELANIVKNITGYKLGEKSAIRGLDYNWMIMDQLTPTVLIETGTVQCPLPYTQWNEIWLRNKDLITQLAMIYACK